MRIEVKRQLPDNGIETLGDLSYGDFKCESLELPWYNNQRRISCIPAGLYKWKKVGATTAIPYEHILILDVKGRDGICIHRANYYTQIKGCIAVGDKEVDINKDGQMDVTNSKNTFTKLMALLPEEGEINIS